MHDPPNLESYSVAELIRIHRATLKELWRRGVVRTMNSPQGDWAELLVARAYEGELAPNSEKSYDVLTGDGRRLQVKARVLDPDNVGSHVTSPFRSWDFDAALILLLADDDLSVLAAAELPRAVVEQHASYRAHVNGAVVRPTRTFMGLGRDVTELLREAATRI